MIPQLLDLVDIRKIGFVLAIDISYFDNQVQQWIYEYFTENGFLKPAQIAGIEGSALFIKYHTIQCCI